MSGITLEENDVVIETIPMVPEGKYITVHKGLTGEVNLYYEDRGEGRPLILIHGWPLSGQAWSEQVPAFLNAGFRVIDYDRRGFGRSDKPSNGYDYATFAEDLNEIITQLDLRDVTLIGFSMGGGEVASYISKYGTDRLHSAILASAVPPYMAKTDDNPEGPLTKDAAGEMEKSLKDDRDGFFPEFANNFYSANGQLTVDQSAVDEAITLSQQSDQKAALKSMEAFATTDFRDDLAKFDIPTLIIHGDADGIVPFEGSGKLAHEAISGSELVLISGGPHGVNVSNADEWNSKVIDFLESHA